MSSSLQAAERQANWSRFHPGDPKGHYESWFMRANHPSRPLGFWIRYTLFSPKGDPGAAVGELWAVYFDGEAGRHVALKQEVALVTMGGAARPPQTPLTRGGAAGPRTGGCFFSRDGLLVRIGEAELSGGEGAGKLAGELGSTASGEHRIEWDLRYRGGERPVFMLPLALYEAPLPKAKMLVGLPLAVFEGRFQVDGQPVDVEGWVGSQNHNWGSKHTDDYAWGQVAGFDGQPESFLELGTGRIKIGPVWTPYVTPIVLRHRGKEHAFTTPGQLLRGRGRFRCFDWRFSSETALARVEGRIHASREDFVGLAYKNPPGGVKHCLNTKIATCELTLTHKVGAQQGEVERLTATRRAAFEILTDARDHGVKIYA